MTPATVGLQVLDRSFMAAVLLMTTMWQATAVKERLAQNQFHRESSSASPAPAIRPASNNDKSLVAHMYSRLSLGWRSAATTKDGNKNASSSNSRDCAQGRSASIAAELLNSLSYLQFCRMRLTAYNALLKGLLSAVSSSAQVRLGLRPLCLPCVCVLSRCL